MFCGFFSPLTIVDYRNVIKELKKNWKKIWIPLQVDFKHKIHFQFGVAVQTQIYLKAKF